MPNSPRTITVSQMICVFLLGVAVAVGSDTQTQIVPLQAATHVLQPGKDVQYQLQSILINAVPGDVIELQAGTYHFDTELNIACDQITIRGAGRDKTVLSFKTQQTGSDGILATGNAFVIEHLAVEDTVGNGIKVIGSKDVTFCDVRVEWTGGSQSTNGAYGVYPVECHNVLIENCVVIGASDAGIYVGQSQDVVVKGCRVERNVAGIEIENTIRADVFDNIATNNTGGILVFDLPGLTLKNGRDARVFKNQIHSNNHVNFAPRGTMVADVPQGTGVMVMAANHVEIFDNDIHGNQTCNILLVSFLITERKIKDKNYDPFSEGVSIHDNRIRDGGRQPSGQISLILGTLIGVKFPDILFDGWVDAKKMKEGKLPPELGLSIRNNGTATFANFHFGELNPANVLSGKYQISRDPGPYAVAMTPLHAVKLRPHATSFPGGNPAVAVYRAAPRLLSDWKLYTKESPVAGDSTPVRDKWIPAAGWLPYELNTALYSDGAQKHRFIRLPPGQQIRWQDRGSIEFPVGTVIAKTFAYPAVEGAAAAGSGNERFVETRIQLLEPAGWYGYSYVWNKDQTDAELRLGGGVVEVSRTDEHGTLLRHHYDIPNANQCLSCHAQNGRYVPLGTTGRNLNRNLSVVSDNPSNSAAPGPNQLDEWVREGKLTGAPLSTERHVLANYADANSGTVAMRARAWLDVNCAHCHNPLGSARTTGLDLRTEQGDLAQIGVWKTPVATGKGSGGRRYDIIPGKPDESILMYRLESVEPGVRMPSLGRNLTHPKANDLVRSWIQAMAKEAE